MIARYNTLVTMHHDLMQLAQEGQEKIERAKAQLARYMEEKDDEILQHNNELARLQMRFDRARSDVIFWVRGRAGGRMLVLSTCGQTDRHMCTHTHTDGLAVGTQVLPYPSPGISLGTHSEHCCQEDPPAWHH